VFQEKLSPESLQEKNRFKKIPAKKFPVQVRIVNLSVISTVCGSLGFHCYVLVTLTENCLSYTHAFGLGQKIPYCTSSDFKFICYILLFVKSSFGMLKIGLKNTVFCKFKVFTFIKPYMCVDSQEISGKS
jgi:hypothetical protein